MPSSSPDETISFGSLPAFERLWMPIWVFDSERARMVWANRAALDLWDAPSLEEFLARDFSDMSEGSRARLASILTQLAAGRRPVDQWTFYPRGNPVTVRVRRTGIRLPDGRLAMLHEARAPDRPVDPSMLRGVEALNHTNMMISLFSIEGDPIMRNPAAARAYGEPDDGAALWSLFADAALPGRLRAEMEAGRTFSAEARMLTRGGPRWHGLDARPVTDPASGAAAILVNEQPIDKRVEAERHLANERALLRTLIDSVSDLIFFKDTGGVYLGCNKAFQELAGRTEAEIVGRRDTDLLPPEIAAFVVPEDRAVLDGGQTRVVEGTVMLPDGRALLLETVKTPLRSLDGETVGLVGVARDVSERRRAAMALEAKSQDLARSNAELEQFAYVVSHDLRQPLRSVASFLTLLEQHLGGTLDADGREFIDFARAGAQRMDRLIVDLLEYSRIGRKVRPMETVALDEAVQDALLDLEAALAESRGRVTVDDPLPVVTGDRVELMRLLQNLIGNALKYRDPDRPPAVRVSAAGVADGWRISVADNGIGIASEHLERIFGIFQRLHGRDEYEGTGIGLAVCRKIVEHHNGRIWAESEPGRGSVFHFILPRTGAPGGHAP